MSSADALRSALNERLPAGSAEREIAYMLADILMGSAYCASCLKPAGTESQRIAAATALQRLLAKRPMVEDDDEDPLTMHLRFHGLGAK